MTRGLPSILTLALALLLAVPSQAGKKKLPPEEASRLLETAKGRLTLDETLTEPLRVSAELRFLFDEAAPTGVHQLVAMGAGQWRSEMALPGWREARIRFDGRSWTLEPEDNQADLALLADLAGEALTPLALVDRIHEPRGRRVRAGGRELVELRSSAGSGLVLRVDPRTGDLVSSDDGITRFDFTGARLAGGRAWPETVRVTFRGNALLQVTVAQPVSGGAAAPASLFTPPPTARERVWEGAPGLIPPRLLREVTPEYPARLRQEGVSGSVIIRGVIDTRGRLRSPVVLKGAHPDLNASALVAVAQRLYTPGELEGRPVEVKTTIRLQFQLR